MAVSPEHAPFVRPAEPSGDGGPTTTIVGSNLPEELDLPPVSTWFIFVYALTNFGLFLVVMTPSLFSMAVKLAILDPEGKQTALGLALGIGALVNIVAMPIAGVLSDRTTLRWGRRRPWLLLGIVIAAIGAVVVATASSVGIVILGGSIANIAMACVNAAISPVIAERVPLSQRGKVSAFSGISVQIAGVTAVLVGSMLTKNLLLLFLFPVAVLAVTSILYFITIPDRPAHIDLVGPAGGILGVFRAMLFNPRKHRDFSLVWLGKLLLQIGINMFSTYQLYFLLDRLGMTPEQAGPKLALVGGIGLLVTMSFAILGGVLSDRLKRRKVFIYFASGLVAAGLVVMAFAMNYVGFAVAALIILAGAGLFGAVDVALVGDVLPDKADGASRWMSIYGVGANLPSAIAPVIAPLILLIGSPSGNNYTALFIFGGVITIGAAITASAIRDIR